MHVPLLRARMTAIYTMIALLQNMLAVSTKLSFSRCSGRGIFVFLPGYTLGPSVEGPYDRYLSLCRCRGTIGTIGGVCCARGWKHGTSTATCVLDHTVKELSVCELYHQGRL